MQRKRILVIDDEEVVRDSVARVLRSEGLDADACPSGRRGIELALQNDYDLVLTDIRMPDIGGMRVLREIKKAKPALPVILITGYASVQSAVQAMKLGAADYLEKPFTPDQLLASVRAALAVAAAQPAEQQGVVHRDEILKVLERAGADSDFVCGLLFDGVRALDPYDLTGPEKLAILTGDLEWIERHVGPLTALQRRWLEQRVGAEIW
jgi:DNA-binding response OmpR family regulator